MNNMPKTITTIKMMVVIFIVSYNLLCEKKEKDLNEEEREIMKKLFVNENKPVSTSIHNEPPDIYWN
jgi:hypothetical protein